MKSRKLGFLGFRKRKTSSRDLGVKSKSLIRKGLFETLENRELMAGDWDASYAALTGKFTSSEARNSFISWVNSMSDGGSGSKLNGEGGPGGATTVSEAEPNNTRNAAQLVPFGLQTGQFQAVSISGSNLTTDVDWYAFDLKGGDIIDVALTSPFLGSTLGLYDSNNKELGTAITLGGTNPRDFSGAFPVQSPLTAAPANGANNALHWVTPADGRYYLRVSDVGSSYTAVLRAFRPVLESQPTGSHQKLFVDFSGGFVARDLFGFGPGSTGIIPMSETLTTFGLQESDNDALIDAIMLRVKDKFARVAQQANNSGFQIEILNSRDDGDQWGLANVTRVIVGGLAEPDPLFNGLLGIAEEVDAGNFNTEATALCFTPPLAGYLGTITIAGSATWLDAISESISNTIVHEAGHTFGLWHQDETNAKFTEMDTTVPPEVDMGAGIDLIYGTSDDAPLQFTSDRFAGGGASGAWRQSGYNDNVNWLGWSLTTGIAGGRVEGKVFRDMNLNRSLDTSDLAVGQVTVFADLDNDGTIDSGEFNTTSNADGTYSLLVPAGSYTIRSVIPAGYRAVAPTTNAHSVTVALNQVVSQKNFGLEFVQSTATGRKWNDLNGNGLRDSGEPGVANVSMYFDLDGDGRIDIGEPTTKTKADGTYVLPTLSPGTYTIREVLEPGWVQIFPGVASNYGHTITLTGNAVTDALVLAGIDFGNQLNADFGDAPTSYGDASAGFVAGLSLGTSWDSESASNYSGDASGDDSNNTDDEDGITLSAPLVRGRTDNAFTIATTNTTGQTATLNVWLDLDRDGVFSASEKIADATHFSIASSVATGSVVARFRYGFQASVGPTGYTSSGEVEDYIFNISDTSRIAVDDVDTVQRNGSKIIDVLANDFASPGETLKVISASGTTASGGSASPTADGSGVFYVAPLGFVGTDTFQYTMENSHNQRAIATVTINVSLFFENPVAVDDSFDLPTNSIDYPLNILANDIEGQNGALTIVSFVRPDKGGQIIRSSDGKSLRYTPLRDFGGTEFVTYTVSDSAGNTSTATVTLHTLEGDRDDDQIQIRVEAVSTTTGAPISQIQQGQDFKLKVYVDDLRHDTSNPGSGAGVFAAYFDLLYNLQLVSTKSGTDPRFNFDVKFLGTYANFTTGDASIPGVINEIGATSDSLNMQAPNELPFAEITFTARSPGIVSFLPDPADVFPRSDSLLFDTPDAVPVERIRYKGTQIQIFGDGVQFPVAVDDSTRVLGVDTVNQINVLANDLRGSTDSIKIVAWTNGSHGFTNVNRGPTSQPEDDTMEYTPATGYSGFDQFTYTIEDLRGIRSTATVTVHVGTAGSLNPDSDDIIDYELVVTDLNGTPIDQVTKGQQFQLRAFVKDLRDLVDLPDPAQDTRGVFAAYQDVLFNRKLVSPITSTTNDPNLGFTVSFGALYNLVREGDIRTSGVLNEIGAVATFDHPEPIATNPQGYLDRRIPLFTVTMMADAVGTAEFYSDPVDIVPLHESLVFDPAATVTPDKIHFGFDSVTIVSAGGSGSGEYYNVNDGLDVNGDGYRSPIDALIVINALNNGGSGPLTPGGGEGETRYYIDTNNDNFLSPADALKVINWLIRRGSGEGESAAPTIDSDSGLVAEGENAVSVEELNDAGSNLTGPQSSTYYMMSADSWFASQDDDAEEESLFDDLASDVNSCWNS